MTFEYYIGFEFITAKDLHQQLSEKYKIEIEKVNELSVIYGSDGFKNVVTALSVLNSTDEEKTEKILSDLEYLNETKMYIKEFE